MDGNAADDELRFDDVAGGARQIGDDGAITLTPGIEQARFAGEETEIGTIWNNMAIAYVQKGDWIKAETYAKQAEDVYRRFLNSLRLAEVC